MAHLLLGVVLFSEVYSQRECSRLSAAIFFSPRVPLGHRTCSSMDQCQLALYRSPLKNYREVLVGRPRHRREIGTRSPFKHSVSCCFTLCDAVQ